MLEYRQVLDFWFNHIPESNWFKKDPEFDNDIEIQFAELHKRACTCELFDWRQSPEGRLAEIIILDQFSRNLFRDKPQAFAADPLALALAQEAVARGDDLKLEPKMRSFIYMPYMHSESLAIHLEAVRLFSQPGLEHNLNFEIKHKEIIERFGRYPHRNAILARASTEQELQYLQQPGSSF